MSLPTSKYSTRRQAWPTAVAQRSILSHGGRYLVAGPTPEPVEGTWDAPGILVVEFSDAQWASLSPTTPEMIIVRKTSFPIVTGSSPVAMA
ncbi:DUF1330 domain-containing protein [Nocardia flavorosea]|uniref:DUF1330 domain-containing protein n=1 Tax=Nocardia TaxID=1817 RepID=UPI003A5CA907